MEEGKSEGARNTRLALQLTKLYVRQRLAGVIQRGFLRFLCYLCVNKFCVNSQPGFLATRSISADMPL